MIRLIPSLKIANKTARFIFVVMITMLAVSIFGAAAEAKKDWPLSEFQKEHLKETKQKELEKKLEALTKVPGKASNKQMADIGLIQPELQVAKLKQPKNVAPQAQSMAQAQGNQAGNNAGDIAREQAIQSIDYCQRVMKNFTTEGGNKWNKYRDYFFVPMALLLILPGAVLTQVRAIIAQGNPVLVGQASPLEGIQRAIIGIFLVPSTYLVVNYSIDLGNSLQYTIASEYKRLQGTDMYEDAMCAEIRAFGVRYLAENEGSSKVPDQDSAPRGDEPFAKLEGKLWGKLADPCTGLFLVPENRDDNSMSQGSVGVRLSMNMTNAGINTAWSILTAFQMAFMYYLFFVGPIMAALWTWPMKMFNDAFPAWVEGVVTLAFWSFFWNVVILLLALTKSEQSSGLYMVSACNFLSTAAVKYAFDFAGLMRGAAAQAESMGAKAAAKAGQGGGGKGGKGGGGKGGKSAKKSNAGNAGNTAPHNPALPATSPAEAPTQVAATKSLIPKPVVDADAGLGPDGKRLPSRVPEFLTVNSKPLNLNEVVVEHTLPPLHDPAGNLLTANDLDPFVVTTNFEGQRFNVISKTWENPIPMAGGPDENARNTIGSVIGNAIQAVFTYPSFAKIVDPDSAPTPLVEADPGKSFDTAKSVSGMPQEAQTCNSLLAKMPNVVCDNQRFAPPAVEPLSANEFAVRATQLNSTQQDKPALSFAKELAKVYATHMSQELAEQEAYRQSAPAFASTLELHSTHALSETAVIAVADHTAPAAPIAKEQAPQRIQQATTNTSLSSILGNLGLAMANAPVNPNVSNSWFASAAEEVEMI